MAQQEVAPYGSWPSPITADIIASGSTRLFEPVLDRNDLYWLEMRPAEGGRYVLMKKSAAGQLLDLIPAPFSVRTRVHEYGGGAYTVSHGTVYFSNNADQSLYRIEPDSQIEMILPAGQRRFADLQFEPNTGRLICVCEDHSRADSDNQVENYIISVNTATPGDTRILASGHDFYASPAMSPDGTRLAWLAWNHPNMPWDETELWLGELAADGTLLNSECIAGGQGESIFQPQWSPDGTLYFVSDRSGWWNLYRWQHNQVEPLYPMDADFGRPQWVFGLSTYGFASPAEIICTYTRQGEWYLARLDLSAHKLTTIDEPFTEIAYLRARPGGAVFTGGSPTKAEALIWLDLMTMEYSEVYSSSTIAIDTGYFSLPEPIEYPTEDGRIAYGFFYHPRNKAYTAPAGEKPPLLVISHGGPTGATSTILNYSTQYWTSRGFAVLDVNYGGSSGFGREYRQRLYSRWGVVDVDDCVNGARYLVDQGLVDGKRLAIRGKSAGGYTTLSALTFRDIFTAGASHYGISDLEALARDTHKFELRYTDRLIGPYPERRDLYLERGPINAAGQLNAPVIFFQGLDDKVVPPNQAETMVSTLRDKGIPVAYLAFEGEQHGFRRGENIKRSLEAELYFYSRIFGFPLAEPIDPVKIENLD